MATLRSPTGDYVEVPDDQVGEYRGKGFEPLKSRTTRTMVDEYTGEVSTTDDAAAAASQGYSREATDADRGEQYLQTKYGQQKGRAFVEGVLRTATFGASDVLAEEMGISSATDLRERRERTGGASTLGEVGGALLPMGGATLAAKAGGKVAGAIAKEGAGLGARVAGAAAGAATEGAMFGAGQGVSELALDDRPVTAERALSVIGSNALFGAAVGGAVGAGGRLLAEGAKGAREAGGELVKRVVGKTSKVDDATHAAEGKAIAETFRAEQKAAKDWFNAVDDASARKVLNDSSKRVRKFGDQVEHIAEDPRRALGPLRERVQKLEELVAKGDDLRATVEIERRAVAAELPEVATEAVKLTPKQTQLYRAWSGEKIKGGKGVTLEPARVGEFRAALESGEVASARLRGLDDAVKQLEADRAVIDRIKAWDAAGKELREAAKKTGVQQAGEGLATGAAGSVLTALGMPGMLAFPLAAKAGEAIGGKLAGVGRSLAERTAATGKSVGDAVDMFMRATAPVVRAAPVLTSKVLAQASYAPAASPALATAATKPKSEAVASYRDRERELLSQTEPGPDGRPKLRQAAARQLHERLEGIWAINPRLADALEVAAARRLEFVASKLPARPATSYMRVGPDSWQPGDLELAKFARYVDAAEGGPPRILARLNDATMTPEDAETLRELYPETYQEIQAQVIERLPEIREAMPYAKRLMLGILLGVPTDPALEPANLAALQATYNAPAPSQDVPQSPSQMGGGRGSPKALQAPEATQAQQLGSA